MSEKFYLENSLNATQFAISEIKHEGLKQNAETIRKAGIAADLASGTIAVAFAECARIIAHEETEYDSIQDFGAKVFGLKKSQSYSLAVIGAHQIPVKDKSGKVKAYTDDYTTNPDKPYMNTALQLIITYSHKYNEETVRDFVRKECTSEMSFRALKNKLAERFDKGNKITAKSTAENGTAENGTAENGTAKKTETIKLLTIQIPENIALAIKNAVKLPVESDAMGTLIDALNAAFKAKSNSVKVEKMGHMDSGKWVSAEIK